MRALVKTTIVIMVLYSSAVFAAAQNAGEEIEKALRSGSNVAENTSETNRQFLAAPASASLFSLRVTPSFHIPLGGIAEYYSLGIGGMLSAEYRLPFLPFLYIGGDAGYNFIDTKADVFLSTVYADLLVGGLFRLRNKLHLHAYASGGYYYGFLSSTPLVPGTISTWNPKFSANIGVNFYVLPILNMRAEVGYTFFIGSYHGLQASIGTSFHFGAEKRKPQIEILDIELLPVFPVFYKYYDNHSIGRATLINNEKMEASNIKLTFFIRDIMDAPKECAVPPKINGKDETDIDFTMLFNENILEITESTKLTAQIDLDYEYGGKSYSTQITQTVRVHDRNAMQWDDDRKASAFVTAKDPQVITFAKTVATYMQEMQKPGVDTNFITGLALHEALRSLGMMYVIDPKTPYTELSENSLAIDYLQFPSQTLSYSAGDCDDLAILYCALFESLGIETAFITVPGHIYMAFRLDMSPEEAEEMFTRPEDLIIYDETVWIPVEATQTREGFLTAWETGAKQWRENSSRDSAQFYPVHEAWQTYEPVGYPSIGKQTPTPDIQQMARNCSQQLTLFISRQIETKVIALKERIEQAQDPVRFMNKLGVVYARYGLADKAEQMFLDILKLAPNYCPALVNLGNLYYMKKEMSSALNYYLSAVENDPDSETALANLSKVYFELEDYENASVRFAQLQDDNPSLADKYSYISTGQVVGARASEVQNLRDRVEWEEEE
jgi:tetratricopeptide (TPR) repeat protein